MYIVYILVCACMRVHTWCLCWYRDVEQRLAPRDFLGILRLTLLGLFTEAAASTWLQGYSYLCLPVGFKLLMCTAMHCNAWLLCWYWGIQPQFLVLAWQHCTGWDRYPAPRTIKCYKLTWMNWVYIHTIVLHYSKQNPVSQKIFSTWAQFVWTLTTINNFHYLIPGYPHSEILSELLALDMEYAWPLEFGSFRNGRNNNFILNFNSNTVNNEVTKQNQKTKKPQSQFLYFHIFPSEVVGKSC